MTNTMGSTYVGRRVSSVATSLEFEPISKVVLYVSDGVAFTAGRDGGQIIEVDCPYGTQTMANAILRRLQEQKYVPIDGQDAILNPAAELGDGLTMAGAYTLLASIDMEANGLGTADVSAPGKREPESELGAYKGSVSRQISRNAAELRSSITKTAEEIMLSVEDTAQGLATSITQTADQIRAEITGPEGSLTILASIVDGFTVTDSSGTTRIRGAAIETGSITADALAAGTITADKIQAGSISFGQLSDGVKGDISTAQSTADRAIDNARSAAQAARNAQDTADDANDTVKAWTYRGTTYIDGTKLMTDTVTASKLQGGTVQLLNDRGSVCGEFTITTASSTSYALDMTSTTGGLRFTASRGDVFISASQYGNYIQIQSSGVSVAGDLSPSGSCSLGKSSRPWSTIYLSDAPWEESDRRLKRDIEPIDDRYLAMLDRIQPVRYRLVKGSSERYHTGFIAQDVQTAMIMSGLDSTDLAAWGQGDTYQILRYEEFIPIILAKLKRLEAIVNDRTAGRD